MEMKLDGIYLPIYRNLWIYWITIAIGTALLPFDNIACSLIGIALNLVGLYQMYQMRGASEGLAKAFRLWVIALALTIGGLLLTLLALGSALAVLLLLVSLAGVIMLLVAQYFFYAALRDLAQARAYDYPPQRIMWIFYLALGGGIVMAILNGLQMTLAGIILNIAVQVVSLALLWQYLQAVGQNENG